MRGVSEVIAIILILMITISLAGLAYMFMSTTMSDVTSSAGSTVDTTTSSMLTSFTIESMDVAKVYVRNTGQNAWTSLSVYVNDEPAVYNITPSISAGTVGTITIYSFIPDGATVKVTSPNGFSTSKVAHPCDRAVGCWDFDEGSGTVAYDSSPNGNTGTIVGGPSWTSGKYGGALQFDNSNSQYVNFGDISALDGLSAVTVEVIVYPQEGDDGILIDDSILLRYSGWASFLLYNTSGSSGYLGQSEALNQWHHMVGTYDSSISGNNVRLYSDDQLSSQARMTGSLTVGDSSLLVAVSAGSADKLYGKIDEVRIYNRAIY